MRVGQLFLFSLSALVIGSGCRQVDPAPTELNELLAFLFVEYDNVDEELLAEAAINARSWWNNELEQTETGGSVTDLTGEQVATVGIDPEIDMSAQNGVFHFIEQQCSLELLEELYLFEDQEQLFPGQYDAYTRTFNETQDCYLDNSCHDIWWDVNIEDSLPLGVSSIYDMISGLRRIPDQPDPGKDDAPLGLILSRTYLPEPAEVGGGEGPAFFDQSYQIELFLSNGPDTTLHLYGLWNSGGVNGISPDNPIWTNSYLDGIKEWDWRLDELCAMEDPFAPPVEE